MKDVYVGKIVNTHGLKGELRILSTFSHKQEIFKPGFSLYIDGNPYKIQTYRMHKNYDMVTFEGFYNIDQVLPLKGHDVTFKRDDLTGVILDVDFIGLEVHSQFGKRGTVTDILEGVKYNYLVVLKDHKTYYVPNIPEFIQNVSMDEKKIEINEIEGLLDEN